MNDIAQRRVTRTFCAASVAAVAHVFILAVRAQGVAPLAGLDKAADIARQKDIVWLSLATAIVAIFFCFWLVTQLIRLQRQTIQSLSSLRRELECRPCFWDKVEEGLDIVRKKEK